MRRTAIRDQALIPGPTAGQLDVRGKAVIALAVFVLLVCVLVAAGQAPAQRPGTAILGAALCALGLAFGGAFVWLSTRKSLAEFRSGYSTMNDVAGLELRHPRTGALVRARDVPVEKRSTRRIYDGIGFTRDKTRD